MDGRALGGGGVWLGVVGVWRVRAGGVGKRKKALRAANEDVRAQSGDVAGWPQLLHGRSRPRKPPDRPQSAGGGGQWGAGQMQRRRRNACFCQCAAGAPATIPAPSHHPPPAISPRRAAASRSRSAQLKRKAQATGRAGRVLPELSFSLCVAAALMRGNSALDLGQSRSRLPCAVGGRAVPEPVRVRAGVGPAACVRPLCTPHLKKTGVEREMPRATHTHARTNSAGPALNARRSKGLRASCFLAPPPRAVGVLCAWTPARLRRCVHAVSSLGEVVGKKTKTNRARQMPLTASFERCGPPRRGWRGPRTLHLLYMR